MSIGTNIREFRGKNEITQKELAERLHVTFQAVSRWENDETEPSIDTIKEMTVIFNCTTDELLGNSREKDTETVKEEPVVVQEPKIVLGVCEHCNKPIFESDDLKRFTESKSVYVGRAHHIETRTGILCNNCNKKRIEKEKKAEEIRLQTIKKNLKTRRIHSYIWSAICSIVLVIVGISFLRSGESQNGILSFISAGFAFTFVSTMILNNTFLTDMWLSIASWGFVKLPGIIFEFSFDGFIFLIIMKVLFFILGITLSILAIIFATVLSMGLSIFVYPFALAKNIKGIDED